MAVGSNFGVDANGNMFATNGNLTGKITANEGVIGGFNITTTANLNTHVFQNSLYVQTSSNNFDYEAGLSKAVNATDLMFYVKRKDSSASTWSGATDMFFVRANGGIKATSGIIGGWEISSEQLRAGYSDNGITRYTAIQAPTASNTYVFAAGGTNTDSYGQYPFRVTKDGALTASSANIDGTVRIRTLYLGSGGTQVT